MFGLNYLFPWGYLLQGIALIHAIRRRADTYWYFIILMGGLIGAVAYIVIEMVPDLGLARKALSGMGRKSRIRQVEAAILDNPSAANYEELGDLLFEEGQFAESRSAYDKSIQTRNDSIHAIYRRGRCAIELGEFEKGTPDLEHVIQADQKYDSWRAAGLLAHAYANTGHPEEAEEWFVEATRLSTTSETFFNYACFLKTRNRNKEAIEWAQKIVNKQRTRPRYLKRLELPWVRKASALVKELTST